MPHKRCVLQERRPKFVPARVSQAFIARGLFGLVAIAAFTSLAAAAPRWESLSNRTEAEQAPRQAIASPVGAFVPQNSFTEQALMVSRDVSKLPVAVQRMRQAILQAAVTGEIEQLRVPIEMNELPPIFGPGATGDAIAYLKAQSADGKGRESLAILFNLLTNGYAVAHAGTPSEMIVWPYHAVIPLNALTPPQEVDFYRFLPPAAVKDMIAKGRYAFYSVGIGRDGVWHYFTKE